ncbi:hypothetical protein V6N13_012116 [Hibiscus sabdariffa]
MSPFGDGAINRGCRCSCSSGDDGGLHDGATNCSFSASHDKTCTHCARSSISCFPSALGFDSILLTDSKKLRRIFVASAKGFSIGAGLQGGLAIFSILARLRRKKSRTAKWRALVAGLVAGPSMLLTGSNTHHTNLSIYILMQAAVLASRCGIKSKRFGKLCKPLTWKHGDVFLMCLSASEILTSYILKQDSLPPSYKSFLHKHGGKDIVILQGVKELASSLSFTTLEAIEKLYKATGVEVKLDPNMKIPCSFIVKASSKAPSPLGLHFAVIVLSLDKFFCNAGLIGYWEKFPTGLSVAIEKKSRRMEISLYCIARAMESLFTWMAEVGYLPGSEKLKRPDVVIFSLSTAIIMHCYAQERELFHSKYLNVLDWIFGVPPHPSETPSCKNIRAV